MAYPSVNFQPTSSFMGLQPINVASTTQSHVLGTVIRARDVTYGEGQFIYLLGVASTAAGDAVCFNSKTGVTVRAVAGGPTSIGAVGIAMAATVAGQYGWYQISGSGPINAATTAANTQAFITATAGQIDDTGSNAISGMTITAATSGGFATVQIDGPAVNPSDSGVNTGDVTLATVGSTPAAAGASLSGQVLTLQPADETNAGVVSTQTQTFAGAKVFTGNVSAAEVTASSYINASLAGVRGPPAAGFLYFQNRGADSAVANGTVIDTEASYSTSGAKLLSVRTGFVEKTFVDRIGNVEVTTVGSGFILKSPDGTRFKIAVANDGTLSASAA